jgi:uncharacterized coiled-coil protein SlyX
MKETTKAHIRKQSSTIDGIVGELQSLAAETWTTRERLQQRVALLVPRLDAISDSLTKTQGSEVDA